MKRALALAHTAAQRGEVPVGAVVVDPAGVVVAEAHNERESLSDPTAHAEILALRRAGQNRGVWRLSEMTLYVTLEPCPMCAGALINSRLGELVYGAADPKAGACGSLLNIPGDPRFNHRLPARGLVLADECAQVLRDFFRARRRGLQPLCQDTETSYR